MCIRDRPGAQRRVLPRLWLLHAVSRGHRDQPVRPHVAHAAPGPRRRVAHGRVAGEDAQNRAVPPLRPLCFEVSLRPQHPRAPAGKLQGLLAGSRRLPEGKISGISSDKMKSDSPATEREANRFSALHPSIYKGIRCV